MQDIFVKICGITTLHDALHAVRCKADAVGFVFSPEDPRCVTPETASDIIARLPDYVSKVGVFQNADPHFVHDIVTRVKLSAVQLLGNEGPDDLVGFETSVIKAFRIHEEFDVEVMRNYIVDAFLLNALQPRKPGRRGRVYAWNVALKAKNYGRVILSGGLTPENVEGAIRFVRPYGVDVCSGVETEPGMKDPAKVRDFIGSAKSLILEDTGQPGEEFDPDAE